MTIRVVEPPDIIMLPADIPGEHDASDMTVAAMIFAATEELDGPNGLLQRAIGPQTLELVVGRAPLGWCEPGELRLPMPPLIAVESITSEAEDGAVTTLSPSDYVVRGIGTDDGRVRLIGGWPDRAEEVRIRYRAGYDGKITEAVPERVKRAVALGVANMQALGRDNLHLRAEEFEGIGRQEFIVSETASKVVRQAMMNLVAGLRVFR